MMPNRTRRKAGWPRLRVAAVLLGTALLGGATTEDASLLESRRHSIELMSQADLSRLKRNYETYLKLTPERREQLSRLNEDLEQDTKDGGHLQKLLEQYNVWLFKLSPFDRDKLLGIADPGERADQVQKLLQEQQKQRLARATKGLSIPYFGGRFDSVAPLTSSELDAVLDAVERNYLSDDLKRRIEKSSSQRERHLQILRATMRQLQRERGAAMKIAPNEMGLVNTIVDAIPNPAIKAQLGMGNPSDPLRRQIEIRRQLGQIIGRSVLAEWKTELEESPATPEQIDETSKKWVASAKNLQRRAALEQRLQTERGRNLIAAVSAIQFNPHFEKQRPVINWLFRGLSPGPLNRSNAAARLGASNQAPPAVKAGDEPDKESTTD
jgi:hypothetical protein